MYWWLWLVLGLLLLGLEALTPGGFYVLFFGVGALVVGTLVGLGVERARVAAVAALLGDLRGLARALPPVPARAPPAPGAQSDAMDTLEGEVAMPLDDIPPGAVGRAELRGTTWTALNHDSRVLGRGQRCRVARVDGLTLLIRAESNPEVQP